MFARAVEDDGRRSRTARPRPRRWRRSTAPSTSASPDDTIVGVPKCETTRTASPPATKNDFRVPKRTRAATTTTTTTTRGSASGRAEARATTSRVHLSILAAFDRARGARRAASRGRPRRPRSFRLKCAQDFSLQHPHHPWAQKQGVRDARRPTRWAEKFPGCINRSPATTRANAKALTPL